MQPHRDCKNDGDPAECIFSCVCDRFSSSCTVTQSCRYEKNASLDAACVLLCEKPPPPPARIKKFKSSPLGREQDQDHQQGMSYEIETLYRECATRGRLQRISEDTYRLVFETTFAYIKRQLASNKVPAFSFLVLSVYSDLRSVFYVKESRFLLLFSFVSWFGACHQPLT